MKIVKSALPSSVFDWLKRAKKQILSFRGLSRDYGQWISIRDWNSVDEKGEPIPWYTYPTTEYLSHLNLSQMVVFEYGSGNSTLWWARNAKRVVSVEDNREWFEKTSQNLDTFNTQYLLRCDKEEYFSTAQKGADIFIIDGSNRRECAEHVVNIGEGGVMIILDNSDWYPNTVDHLQKKLEWIQIDFHGFGPINSYTWTTSVFLNPLRHQELSYKLPLKSKCGLIQIADG